MSNQPVEVKRIHWLRILPWLHLLSAFRIAIDPRKLLLGGAALVCLPAGDYLAALLPLDGSQQSEPSAFPVDAAELTPWEAPLRPAIPTKFGIVDGQALARTIGPVVLPQFELVDVASRLFHPGNSWSDLAIGWTRLLWMLIVWALFGGALTRMAALDFARDRRIGPVAGLRSAGRRFIPFLTAPLLAFAAVGLFWFLCVIGGLVGRIPVAGDMIVGIFWFLPLFFGGLMAVILIVTAMGWPLMYATIGVEESDSFDGFSRAFNFVLSRPCHYLWNWLVSALYGTLLYAVLTAVVWFAHDLAMQAVYSGRGPSLLNDQAALRFWDYFLIVLLNGFCISYFWSAATINYLVVRQREDAIELHEIYIEEEQRGAEPVPLSGIAATEHEATERPVRPPDDRNAE